MPCSIKISAVVPRKMPRIPIPLIITNIATALPSGVEGVISPYPTVVVVVTAQ
jgi:hypothetical protein